jgi:C4-dicarboxylate-specific signal transduction histidine kinase
VAEPLTIEEAKEALKDAVPDLDRHLADSSLEIISGRDWYLQGGTFDDKRVRARWDERLVRVSAKVMADRVQLQQVLMNLVLNGIEAMRETTGELSIKLQLAEDGQLLISVTDTGVGLPIGRT